MSLSDLTVPDDPSSLDRVPPQDIAAEQCVLGAMLLSKDAIADVGELLRPTDFYRPPHQTIYQTILALYATGGAVDGITVAAELLRDGTIEKVGGAPYLHTLMASVPTAANADYHAQIVHDRAALRRLVEAGTKVVQLGYGTNISDRGDIADVINRAEQALSEATARRGGEDYAAIGDTVVETIHEVERIEAHGDHLSGVTTGFRDLDELTNGLHPGQLIIVAGRPGMGKTTLAIDTMRAVSIRGGLPSALFSLEMNRTEITMRVLAAESRVSFQKMRSGTLGDDGWRRIGEHLNSIAEAPMFIDDSPNLTMMDIRSKARRLKQHHGLALMVVDYLQLMSTPGKQENRQREIADISRSLKLLAKELGIPVIAVSQLNRGSEQRSDKRPQLSDLRESGALEQDADVVILLHRPDMYERECDRAGEADLIVAKYRNGPTKDIVVLSQLHYSRFVDMAT